MSKSVREARKNVAVAPRVIVAPSAERIAELQKIFEIKGWHIGGSDEENEDSDMAIAFNKVCLVSAELTDAEYSLFKEMLSRYTVVPYESYKAATRRLVKKMPVPDSPKEVYHVAPVIAPKDLGASKSGIQMVYPFAHDAWKKLDPYKKNKICDHIFASDIKNKSKSSTSFTSIFVDDFVGTGNTVEEFLDDYELNHKSPHEKIVFAVICIMQKGLDYIRSRGYEVYYDKLIQKGIDDCEAISDKDAAKQLMESLEAKLNVLKGYELGYLGSQALVTMIRTPNNTLPIFWLTKRRGSGEWPAPFPR